MTRRRYPNLPGARQSRHRMLQNQATLFGLDLTRLGSDVRAAWQGLCSWRGLSWLQPRAAVSMVDAQTPPDAVRRASFVALELPEEILLRRQLTLPAMPDEAVNQAVRLDVLGHSPFAADDTVWAHAAQPGSTGLLSVHIVLTSRALVARHIDQAAARLGRPAHMLEVRVLAGQPVQRLTLPGYGEARRRAHERWMARAVWALLTVTLALAGALAVTPTLQLRARALDAADAYAALAKRAGPTLGQREELVRRSTQLQELNALVTESAQPLQVLETLTKALPDDTWIQMLQLQGNKVTLTGQAPNAATLMRELGALPGVRDVKAPSAAIKPQGAPKEVFTIEFTVDGTKFGKAG